MRPQLPDESDVYSFDYKDVMARLSEIFTMIVSLKEPKPIYDYILKSMDELFSFNEMILSLFEEGAVKKKAIAFYGLDDETIKGLVEKDFPDDWFKFEMQNEFKVTKNGYLIDGEKWAQFIKENPEYDVMDVYDNPEALFEEREFPEQWHEGDFFDFLIRDEGGHIIGYLEVSDSRHPEVLPPRNLVEAADIFSQIVGIINRLWRRTITEEKKRQSSALLSMLLGRDLMPRLTEALDSLSRAEARVDNIQDVEKYSNRSHELIEQSVATLQSAKRIIEVESRPYSLLALSSISNIIHRWKAKGERAFDIKIELIVDRNDRSITKIDGRFLEILSSIAELFDSKIDKKFETLLIKISREDPKWITVAISSKEMTTENFRSLRFVMRSKTPTQTALKEGALQIFMINRIISEYGGTVSLDWKDNNGRILLKLPSK